VPCGASLGLEARFADVVAPVAARAGTLDERVVFDDDVEGPPQWTFQTAANGGGTWTIVDDVFASATHSWHAAGSSSRGDSWIVSDPIAIPADAVAAEFTFVHTYSFERGFDGGVVEISDGKQFVDVGPLIGEGAYPLNISDLFGNPLGTRPAWTGGDVGSFKRVTIDMTPFAGRTVRIRLRVGADARGPSGGWWVDDFRLTASVPSCGSAGGQQPAISAASYKNGKLKIKGTDLAQGTTIAVNGRTVLAPVTYRADKGVLRVTADAVTLGLRSGLNVVTVETAGRTSRAFAFAI
jgi:hypothetical protein